MSLAQMIQDALGPIVREAGFYLEDVLIASPGNRRVVTCVVDGEKSLNLDEVTLISREIAALLDEAPFMGETPFTLEVTSPGVDRPLTQGRHWKKNHTRLVRAVMISGEVISGRILDSDDHSVRLSIEEKVTREVELQFTEIKKALVEIEFNRKDEAL